MNSSYIFVEASLRPPDLRLPVRLGTVLEIQINEALIGNPFFLSQCFEVLDRPFVQSNGDLLLQTLGVGILH